MEGRVGPFKVRVNINKVGRNINSIGVDTKGSYKLKLKLNKGILNFSII